MVKTASGGRGKQVRGPHKRGAPGKNRISINFWSYMLGLGANTRLLAVETYNNKITRTKENSSYVQLRHWLFFVSVIKVKVTLRQKRDCRIICKSK